MKKIKIFTILIALTNILWVSCKKEENNNNQGTSAGCTDPNAINYNSSATTGDGSCSYYKVTEEDTSTGTVAASSTMMEEDVMFYTYVSSSSENGETANKTAISDTLAVPSCATISLSPKNSLTWPKTLTIDFNSGCQGFDGKYRKGKIKAIFSGSWVTHKTGDSIKVELENYYVNDTMITGTRYFWINPSNLIAGELSVGLKTDNASIVYPNSTSVTWTQNGTYLISGLKTPKDYTDDIINITLTASGKDVDGNSYTLTTPSALVCKMNCMQQCLFVQGTGTINNTSVSDTTIKGQTYLLSTVASMTLDFGDGTCDSNFNLTTNLTVSTSGNNTSSHTILSETYGPETIDCSDIYSTDY